MNMLDATIEQNGTLAAVVGDQRIALGAETLSQRPALKSFAGRKVVLGIRPEDLEDAALVGDAPTDDVLVGRLGLREALGSEVMAHFAIKGAHAETDETRELKDDAGAPETESRIGASAGEAVLVGRFGARSRIKEGDEVRAVVDTRALHFFDPETGLGIYDDLPAKGAPT